MRQRDLRPDAIRRSLSAGLRSARQLADIIEVSQPTMSRILAELSDEIVRVGATRSIQYALRDTVRGLPDIPIYRVDSAGLIRRLGVLIPVRPEGFVMRQDNGVTIHSDGLPWWLFDMRPQGYVGRAYATRHGGELGLPERLNDWTDTHALRALLAHGHDAVGNLLLGDAARDRFLNVAPPYLIAEELKAEAYSRLAREAAYGELPGSSAGGEQPKFMAFAMTSSGPRYVIVKFSESEEGPVTERWRDLLLAEHLALNTLREAGVPAATTRILDHGNQRFLEVERFDRSGERGRSALISLAAMDAEFVGSGGDWSSITHQLVEGGQVHPGAVDGADLLWAFGTLIGNSDMHSGNLSFVSEHGRPYHLAPAYDMTPMAFQPRSGGGLPDAIPEASIRSGIPNEIWRRAHELARIFLGSVLASTAFSHRFGPCIDALARHIDTASVKIARLG